MQQTSTTHPLSTLTTLQMSSVHISFLVSIVVTGSVKSRHSIEYLEGILYFARTFSTAKYEMNYKGRIIIHFA